MRQVNTSPPYAKHQATTPQTDFVTKIVLIFGGVMFIFSVFFGIYGWWWSRHEDSVFKQMSPAEHLREAKSEPDLPAFVFRHLAAIPQDAPEYKEVPALLQAAKEVEREHQLRDDQRKEAERAKEQRDSDASLSSYWPTTVRVDTDMDSFWLKGEERTCVTTPEANGRVAIVTCNYSSSHQTHNIPVKFWGSVDRNFVSDWRCRREGDGFVCRATD